MKDTLRTVTLEFLRHGPPHNQLLSPLTQYLALCGNHSATTVTMPFEHNQLLIRLNAFMYRDGDDTRKLQLKDTAQIMGAVLAEVPGLIAELADSPQPDTTLTHLRLILSASELALLPFEMANAPIGFPGAGQPLGLQAQAPICVTREVRRVGNSRFVWPRRPRILFIAADAGGEIPLQAHLLALRKVIDPWCADFKPTDDIATAIRDHLVVLSQASVASIQEACAEGDFTHIHILAHGLKLPGDEEKRYGLALHDEHEPEKVDVIDGSRLATLLRTYVRRGANSLSTPAVVTLATCYGGQQGSVVGAGASIAHALHEGGIPLVVASQFPLSFPASVLMAEILYEGFLWGREPCVLLNSLRWQLRSRLPDTHDWAALVAYAALPVNLREQLLEIRVDQAHRSIDAAVKFLDKLTDELKTRKYRGDDFIDVELYAITRVRKKKDAAVEQLKDILGESYALRPDQIAIIYGLLASTEKRDAKVSFVFLPTVYENDGEVSRDEVTTRLERARDYYAKAFEADRTQSWALVQELSLTTVLRGPDAIRPETWIVARELSERDLQSADRKRVAWALGNLIELHLLAVLRPDVTLGTIEGHRGKALDYTHQLARRGDSPFEIYSLRRQIERYTDWFNAYKRNRLSEVVGLAIEIINLLPNNPLFA